MEAWPLLAGRYVSRIRQGESIRFDDAVSPQQIPHRRSKWVHPVPLKATAYGFLATVASPPQKFLPKSYHCTPPPQRIPHWSFYAQCLSQTILNVFTDFARTTAANRLFQTCEIAIGKSVPLRIVFLQAPQYWCGWDCCNPGRRGRQNSRWGKLLGIWKFQWAASSIFVV